MVLILSKAPGHRKKAEECRAMALSVASPGMSMPDRALALPGTDMTI
jgi:hypothetical protein